MTVFSCRERVAIIATTLGFTKLLESLPSRRSLLVVKQASLASFGLTAILISLSHSSKNPSLTVFAKSIIVFPIDSRFQLRLSCHQARPLRFMLTLWFGSEPARTRMWDTVLRTQVRHRSRLQTCSLEALAA
jgi:hypothetical protein